MSTETYLHCRVDGANSGGANHAVEWLTELLAHRAAVVVFAPVVEALDLEVSTWRTFDGRNEDKEDGDIANPVTFLMVHGAHGDDAVVVEDEYGYRYDAEGERFSREDSAAQDAQETQERQARTIEAAAERFRAHAARVASEATGDGDADADAGVVLPFVDDGDEW